MAEPIDWEQFESLSSEEQAKLFCEKPFKEKGQLLLHAHEPLRLTQALSQEELYLTTRELDIEEKSEIVKYANLPQLFFLTDLDCWRGDRLNPKGFLNWLETLENADESVLLKWLIEMDPEMVVAALQKLVRVIKAEREYPADELLGDIPYFSLDDMYYIAVREENLETVRSAFEVLFENHKGRYYAMLEGILSEMTDELEEEAYRMRQVRLADRGFPEPESAFRIYKPLTREEMEKFPRKDSVSRTSAGQSGQVRLPNYPVLWSHERLFLDDVLAHLQEDEAEVLEGVLEEMAWLSNKVIAVQGIDFSSEDRVRQGVERARYFVSIGLELLSGRDILRASALMKEKWLEVIFRWAMTQVLKLRERAKAVIRSYWKGSAEDFLDFLNPPYQFVFQGLLCRIPECFDAAASREAVPLRDFKTLRDIEQTETSVAQIEIIFRGLHPDFSKFVSLQGAMDENFRLSLFNVLGTLFAQTVIAEESKTQMLSPEDFMLFLRDGFEEKGTGRILKQDLKAGILGTLHSPQERELLKSLWGLVFDEIEDDLGRLDVKKKVDTRYLSSVCVLPAKREVARHGKA